MIEKYFRLSANNTNIRTEIIAGVTTFLTMAYILVVNPSILGKSGMDTNAVFTATAVFLEGILFSLLTLLNVRELIVDVIPLSLKHAISVGIGLFIAFIGLQGAGIIVHDKSTLVTLGNLGSPSAIICFFGLVVSGILLALRVKGALLKCWTKKGVCHMSTVLCWPMPPEPPWGQCSELRPLPLTWKALPA